MTAESNLSNVDPVIGRRALGIDDRIAQLSDTYPTSAQIRRIVQLTQAAYDALTPDPATLYLVVG